MRPTPLPPAMAFGRDGEAASPLAVIAVFVLVASGVTALAFFLFFDRPDREIQIRPEADGFVVEEVTGSFRWSSLDIQLLDAAGADRAPLYLDLPDGRVDADDAIALRHQVPAGAYLLRLLDGGHEVGRVVARF